MGTFKQNNDAPATSRILFSLVAKAWVVSINLFRSVSEPDMSSRSMRFPVSSASCKTSRCLGWLETRRRAIAWNVVCAAFSAGYPNTEFNLSYTKRLSDTLCEPRKWNFLLGTHNVQNNLLSCMGIVWIFPGGGGE